MEGNEGELPATLLAAFGACTVVRTAARFAFAKHLRSVTAPNIVEEVGHSFEHHFPYNFRQ